MDERGLLILEYRRGDMSIAELCRRYGVSRKTGYKWIERYETEGLAGLKDRSHAPICCPHRLDASVKERVLAVRSAHPTWGPKKVRAWLVDRAPRRHWPAVSTIGTLFDAAGLTVSRRRRRGVPESAPFNACTAANDVWTVDFKGWFRTADGERCDPLTLSDAHTRYLLRCQAVERPNDASVWPIFDAAFREFGLPKAIRSDNGPPFASLAAGGLSRLSVRLIKTGIIPERIEPGKPQQNGRHERFHLTLKCDTANPPAANRRSQQRRFDAFRKIYNEERPHEALGQTPPARHYTTSFRRYSGRLREPEYPDAVHIRRVRTNGEIKWRGGLVFVSEVLAGEPIGYEESNDGTWALRYGPIALGSIDLRGRFVRCAPALDGLRTTHPNPRG
jgi:transposase InsO family protein